MTDAESKRNKLKRWLKNRYMLVIKQDTTFEEVFFYTLTPLNVFKAVGIILFSIVIGTYFFIAYTPVKEIIPGYSGTEVRINFDKLLKKTDSLEVEFERREAFVENLKRVIKGEPVSDTTSTETKAVVNSQANLDFGISKEEGRLRKEIEDLDRYSLDNDKAVESGVLTKMAFFHPVKGEVSQMFNLSKGHFGLDVISKKDELIKSTLAGTIIFASWTSDAGYVTQIQHENNLISIYKHNSKLLKSVGTSVNAGDPIAVIGDSGELTDGPHLHFELWKDGKPINPQNFLVF